MPNYCSTLATYIVKWLGNCFFFSSVNENYSTLLPKIIGHSILYALSEKNQAFIALIQGALESLIIFTILKRCTNVLVLRYNCD